MLISFHGAARGVTGSCHLVQCAGQRILIDCGLYQGHDEIERENAQPFGFDPGSIDCVLLTHAHLDHCGRLPLLVRQGFRGRIITTAASLELTRLVLLDSAHLQEEEARRAERRASRRGHKEAPGPLYGLHDALHTLDFFAPAARYREAIDLAPGVRATFLDAGHILGSACILLELTEDGRTRRVLFSGDLGNAGRPLLCSPPEAVPADVVVMESTYGDRLHRPLAPSVEELHAAIADTFTRGGNVIIPTFALERAQELLYYLREGVHTGRLPAHMQVFLDSPMAISATEIFRRHPQDCGPGTAALLRQGIDPFGVPGLHLVREAAESMALNRIVSGAVIMAGSGMCAGGRVRHHLRHNLWRRESSVVFVGYAGQGTLARRIIDGARSVRLFSEEVRVQARIHTINGFSAHADQAELLEWHGRTGQPQTTFLVHGEEGAMDALARRLPAGTVRLPEHGEAFPL